ncbi:hypothetical protein [Microbispora sp. KK1-11]|uniref:hypothetical protein n=1 Tax=Microbispora sp. KK1-11 TaxID=2053005 RepID=UPI00115AA7F3|nr:hypothetical protein [Microbispora sp. KK1-11]TQS24516.1 hypothetical protein FLW16_35665 [Microbispora sp. KK1-11]
MRAIEHPLVRELLSLHLPSDDFVIAGSGPLLANGIRSDIGDLDVVARDKAWSKALKLGTPSPAPFGDDVERILLLDGKIEILNGWFPEIFTIDELISRSDVIDGIQYASLGDVCRWKKRHDRPKDQEDIALIERHIARSSTS